MRRCLRCQTKYDDGGSRCPSCGSTSFMNDAAVAAAWKGDVPRHRPPVASPGEARFIGVLLFCIGAFLAYVSIYLPLLQVDAEARTVSIKGAVIVPAALVLGFAWAVFPYRATALLGLRRKMTPLGWIATMLLVGVGVAIEVWLESKLREHGYVRMPRPS